jgi:putative nucleotidyltransferase with HDIG domain
MFIARSTTKALVVDDVPSIAHAVSLFLSNRDFKVRTAFDPLDALKICRSEKFDLVLLDIRMPGMDGLELLRRLKRLDATATYVIMTAEGNLQTVIKALKEGAQGFVVKPFTQNELMSSVDLALEKTRLIRENIRLKVYAPLLESATAALLSALEARDGDTQSHSTRVSYYAQNMSKAFEMNEDDTMQVRIGALFHDIGKIGVPDHVLLKPGKLTDEERREIMKHPEIGAKIISAFEGMEQVAAIVRAHHERYDGEGYPDKLAGKNIPLGARITTVADCFEAMVSPRVYSKGRSVDYALNELKRCAGTQFDPEVVEVFLYMMNSGEIIYQAANPDLVETASICANPVIPAS